jgi:autotransporter-associated beta strand protein
MRMKRGLLSLTAAIVIAFAGGAAWGATTIVGGDALVFDVDDSTNLDLTGTTSAFSTEANYTPAKGARVDTAAAADIDLSGTVTLGTLVNYALTTYNRPTATGNVYGAIENSTAKTLTFSGILSGATTAALRLSSATGTGKFVLSGTNTYDGGTYLQGGTLTFSGTAPLGTSDVTITADSHLVNKVTAAYTIPTLIVSGDASSISNDVAGGALTVTNLAVGISTSVPTFKIYAGTGHSIEVGTFNSAINNVALSLKGPVTLGSTALSKPAVLNVAGSDSVVTLNATTSTIGGLSGEGTIQGGSNLTINLGDRTYSFDGLVKADNITVKGTGTGGSLKLEADDTLNNAAGTGTIASLTIDNATLTLDDEEALDLLTTGITTTTLKDGGVLEFSASGLDYSTAATALTTLAVDTSGTIIVTPASGDLKSTLSAAVSTVAPVLKIKSITSGSLGEPLTIKVSTKNIASLSGTQYVKIFEYTADAAPFVGTSDISAITDTGYTVSSPTWSGKALVVGITKISASTPSFDVTSPSTIKSVDIVGGFVHILRNGGSLDAPIPLAGQTVRFTYPATSFTPPTNAEKATSIIIPASGLLIPATTPAVALKYYARNDDGSAVLIPITGTYTNASGETVFTLDLSKLPGGAYTIYAESANSTDNPYFRATLATAFDHTNIGPRFDDWSIDPFGNSIDAYVRLISGDVGATTPLPSVSVNFVVSRTGGLSSTVTHTTDANGVIDETIASNLDAGTYIVTMTVLDSRFAAPEASKLVTIGGSSGNGDGGGGCDAGFGVLSLLTVGAFGVFKNKKKRQ